jgi:hypothetical protein
LVVCAHPATHKLSFLLPAAISLLVQPGRHQPCLHGCVLTIHRSGLVVIEGPSRERLFEQADRFLRVICKGRPALAIAATLITPPSLPGAYRGGRDGWSIIVGAEIAFSPTALAPVLADQEQRAG